MLRLDTDTNKLVAIQELALAPVVAIDYAQLRRAVISSPRAFLSELGESLFVVGTNVAPTEKSQLHADILCVDKEGNVTILLFPKNSEAALVAGLTLSALVSPWKLEDLVRHLSESTADDLEDYLEVRLDEVNRRQRMILIAHGQSFELSTAAAWLRDRGISISLWNIAVYQHLEGKDDYVRVTPANGWTPRMRSVLRDSETGMEMVRSELDSAEEDTGQKGVDAVTTAGKAADEQRRTVEERYRTIARLSPVGIFHTDGAGQYLFVNERWCEIAGIGGTEALKEGWMRAIHPDDKARVIAAWGATLSTGIPFKAEFRFERREGTSWVLSEAEVVRDAAGRPTGIAGTVTELHRSHYKASGASASEGEPSTGAESQPDSA